MILHDKESNRKAVRVSNVGDRKQFFLKNDRELKVGTRIKIMSGTNAHSQRVWVVRDLGNLNDPNTHEYRTYITVHSRGQPKRAEMLDISYYNAQNIEVMDPVPGQQRQVPGQQMITQFLTSQRPVAHGQKPTAEQA